jgi:uroporphyrinogen-III synthase
VTVLVTRPQHEAQAWVDRLRAAGIDAEPLPLIAIAPAPALAPVHEAWNELGTYRAVMFVSANAVRHFFDARPPERSFATRAWATGAGTQAALHDAGVADAGIDMPRADARQWDSEHLWREVAGQIRDGDRVLIVRGGDAAGQPDGRDWLATQLEAAGACVNTAVAYVRRLPPWSDAERRRARQAASDGTLWLFSSSAAIANLAALVPDATWTHARAVATHPRIAQAARDAGFGDVLESPPGFEAVLASLQSAG